MGRFFTLEAESHNGHWLLNIYPASGVNGVGVLLLCATDYNPRQSLYLGYDLIRILARLWFRQFPVLISNEEKEIMPIYIVSINQSIPFEHFFVFNLEMEFSNMGHNCRGPFILKIMYPTVCGQVLK